MLPQVFRDDVTIAIGTRRAPSATAQVSTVGPIWLGLLLRPLDVRLAGMPGWRRALCNRGGMSSDAPTPLSIFGLVAVMAVCFSACGDDGDPSANDQNDGSATVEVEAPPATRAFDGLREALEAQGLVVKELPKSSLDGAEEGVGISGGKAGSARLFSTEADAKAYADQASEQGAATTVVGTVVLQSTSPGDTQFFVDAYEGG